MDDLREKIAREIAVYLTKRRDVLDAAARGDPELGRAMMDDLADRILAIPEIAEALGRRTVVRVTDLSDEELEAIRTAQPRA